MSRRVVVSYARVTTVTVSVPLLVQDSTTDADIDTIARGVLEDNGWQTFAEADEDTALMGPIIRQEG